jgi:hypothetical protein
MSPSKQWLIRQKFAQSDHPGCPLRKTSFGECFPTQLDGTFFSTMALVKLCFALGLLTVTLGLNCPQNFKNCMPETQDPDQNLIRSVLQTLSDTRIGNNCTSKYSRKMLITFTFNTKRPTCFSTNFYNCIRLSSLHIHCLRGFFRWYSSHGHENVSYLCRKLLYLSVNIPTYMVLCCKQGDQMSLWKNCPEFCQINFCSNLQIRFFWIKYSQNFGH